ncbi:MAG TPA: hypothetical protein VF411_10225 [Bacteroidia bacterium]
MIQYFFTICVSFLSYLAFSQAGYEAGYIITNKGDTIRGQIKDRKYVASPANSDKIKFMDADSKQRKIMPEDIKGYCRKGTVFYRSLPIGIEGKQKFAQILEFGEVILFGYTSNSFVSTTKASLSPASKDKGASSNTEMEYFFQKRKDLNSLMKVKREKFESVSLFYFKDDIELIKKIEAKSLKYEDIRLVVQLYNEFTAKK